MDEPHENFKHILDEWRKWNMDQKDMKEMDDSGGIKIPDPVKIDFIIFLLPFVCHKFHGSDCYFQWSD